MTNHPAVQPVLHRSDVATLRQFLRNEQNDVMAANSATDAEAAEYVAGVQFAIDALETMWRAAVIVSEARAQARVVVDAEVAEEEC